MSLQLADKDVVIGDRARKGLDELPRDQQKNVMVGIRSFFMTTISYLQVKLPLDNQLLRQLGVFESSEKDKEFYSIID